MKNIAFFGKFNSGKSTLINSLLGYKVVPEKPIPTHVPCVKIEYGNVFEIKGFNGSSDHPIYSTWNEFEEKMGSTKFSYVKVISPHSFLKYGFSIWDTPGIDDINGNYTNYAETFLEKYSKQIDSAYFLISNTAITNTEIDFLKKIYKKIDEVVVLHTKAERYNGTDTLKVIADFEKTIKTHIGISPVVRAVSPKMIWEDSISNYFKDTIESQVYEEKISNVVKKFESVNTKIENLISEYVNYQKILNDARKTLENTLSENKSIIKTIFNDNLSANQIVIKTLLKESLENNITTIEMVLTNSLDNMKINIIDKVNNEANSIFGKLSDIQSQIENRLTIQLSSVAQNINNDLRNISSLLKSEVKDIKANDDTNTSRMIKSGTSNSDILNSNLSNMQTAQTTFNNLLKNKIDLFYKRMETNFFRLLSYSSKEFIFIKLSLSFIIILQIIFLTKYFNLW
ncbi:MAG: dynamin family protein [Ignavibacteria bacterium]